ncbi:MAG TPA: hypothetical protein VIL30_06085 [Ramlibacter sp.]|jgi:hypothetical protein
MSAAAAPQTTSQRIGPVLVGQQDGQVFLHFDRSVTWASVTGPQALALAYQLVASARAAGVAAPNQRALF